MTDEEQIDYLKENIKYFQDFKKFINHDKLIKVLTDTKYLKYHDDIEKLEPIGFDIVHTFCPDKIDKYIFYQYAIGEYNEEIDENSIFYNEALHGENNGFPDGYDENELNIRFVPFVNTSFTIIPELLDKCSSIKCVKIMNDDSYGEFSDLWLLKAEEDKKFFIMLNEFGGIDTSPRLLHISDIPIEKNIIEDFKLKYQIS